MRKYIAFILLLTLPGFAFAATNNVTAGTSIYVDSTGNDANGSGFDVANAGGTGIDLSFAAPVIATSVTCTGSSSTTVTQAGGTWTNTMLGNVMQIASGTNFTAGFYTIVTFTNSNNLVLNVSPCTGAAASAGSTRVGGPLLTIAKAFTAYVAGNTINLKNTSTYTLSSGVTLSVAGTGLLPVTLRGYTTTPGDGGQATLKFTAATTGTLLTSAVNFVRFSDLILDCTGIGTPGTGLNYSGNGGYIGHTVVQGGCNADGITIGGSAGVIVNNIITGMTGCTTSHGALYMQSTNAGNLVRGNRITGNVCTGVWDISNSLSNTYERNIIDHNSGASSDGVYKINQGISLQNNDIYLNGRDQVRLDTGAEVGLSAYGNVIWGTSGTCIDNVATATTGLSADYNAIGGGCTARTGVPTGPNDKSLTVDPFIAGGSNNFALNSTTGGGALLRATGWPGVLSSGGTGFLDIGALQTTPPVSASISQ